jgi:hypothetical protein
MTIDLKTLPKREVQSTPTVSINPIKVEKFQKKLIFDCLLEKDSTATSNAHGWRNLALEDM